jgi:hypothetical protein
MGDRANILVKRNEDDPGVYLYTHWEALIMPRNLQDALKRHERWSDAAYLTRIIFDKLTEGQHDEPTGFGISTGQMGGDGERLLTVNCEDQIVTASGADWAINTRGNWSFDEYLNINTSTIW